MIDSKFLNHLISEIQELQDEKGKAIKSLEEFRILLNERAYQRENPTQLFKKNNKNVNDLENEIAKQVILLSRFSKQIIRKGLVDFPQLANEEFTYLYRLMDYDSLTKMQLVEKNVHEKQTGIEIIKRLINNGLLDEFPDEKDKRTKRVKVSTLGKKIFSESVDDVTAISKILSAKIDETKKKNLLALLREVNEFHFIVYNEYKNSDIQQIKNLL